MKFSAVQLSLLGLLLLFAGCSRPDANGPIESNRLKHIMLDGDRELLHIALEKQRVYMDSLYLDKIHDVAVDGAGTIYLAGDKWNHQQVHKFSVEGVYLGNFGQLGDGPGSFRKATRLQLSDSGLWVSDPELSRMSRFNRSTGELLEVLYADSLVTQSKISKSGDKVEFVPVSVIGQNRMLVTAAAERNPAYQPEWKIKYARVGTGKNGQSDFVPLFEGMAKRYIVGDYAGRPAAFTLSINEQPLINVGDNGLLYSANSSEFYILVYSQDGILIRTYSYPYDRLELNPDEDIFPSYTYNRQLLMIRESADYPSFWPALYRMFLDDEQRIWVSTVNEDRKMSEWFVIDDHSQRLLTRFTWPADKPIYRVKNGVAYTIEKNSAGFEVVASYDIILE